MQELVSLPIWVVALMGLFAGWALADHVVLPLLRWLLQRRSNRVIHELNTRLHLKIQPFKLTRRQSLIDRLLFDAKVLEAAEAHARDNGLRQEVVMAKVRRYAEEIVPAFSAYVYFRLGYALARTVVRSLYRVRLGHRDEEALATVDPQASVVFVINHRSNVDYLLVSYMVAERTALSYAVGEWARVWPLATLMRAMGAFFVRRDSRDPLYRRVLERYVATATAEGVTQAVFPEGGLTRDGSLRPAKLGLLDYMVRGFDARGERDLVFVPVAVNYDRVLEDRTLLLDAVPDFERRGSTLGNTLRFLGKNLALLARQRWRRFGYACVNFGRPLSLGAWCAERGIDLRPLDKEARIAQVAVLADELMRRIGEVVPVVPVALVATVFTRRPEATFSELELKAEALALWRELEERGARVYIPRRDQEYAIAFGLRSLAARHLVVERDGLWSLLERDRAVVHYYARSVEHLLARLTPGSGVPAPAATSGAAN